MQFPVLPPRLRSCLSWLDNHILLLLAGFLLAFIPLYPKIPIWSPIEQYIVRVRLEDLFILLTALIWGIQFLRKKVVWKTTMTWFILAYVVVGALSLLTAIFITHTIPLQLLHIGKSVLHYFRYMEYFSLFFIVFSAIKTRRQVWIFLSIFALTVVGITVYGFGQKYFYWPVYSTMNREFSKGMVLYLTPHARVQSTFAGHYDMAAFLVIALPILLAVAYRTTKKLHKFLLFAAFWLGSWLIIVSASRTSFVAYVIALVVAIFLTSLSQEKLRSKVGFFLTRSFVTLLITLILFVSFGADLQERLLQVVDSNPQIHDAYHTFNGQRKTFIDRVLGKIPAQKPPENGISTDDAIAIGVLTPTDERPVATKPKDVYVNVPVTQQVASVSSTGAVTYHEEKVDRTYSANSIKYGLSLGIRLDTLWPQAIKGFLSDPIFGKGYATLNKESVDQFTEAESTDNNFLRTLGETGLAGFITFYGAVVFLMFLAARHFRDQDKLKAALSVGLFSSIVGLLLNAIYIDVFASSKVAQTFWALAGLFTALMLLRSNADSGTVVGSSVKPITAGNTSSLAAALAQTKAQNQLTAEEPVRYTGLSPLTLKSSTGKSATKKQNTGKAKRKLHKKAKRQ